MFPLKPTGSSLVMMGYSDQVIALIKELLVLNRTENTAQSGGWTVEQVEKRTSMRKSLRQELVQLLYLRDEGKS
jgi:hypothetical protein